MTITATQTRTGANYQNTSAPTIDLWKTFHRAPKSEVRALQRYLNAQGAQLKVDGDYGKNTRAALEAARGRVANNVHTQKPAPEGNFFQKNLPAFFEPPKAKPVPARPAVNLSRDYRKASGAEVRTLQRYLNDQGHCLKIDGDYGENTEKALLAERARLYRTPSTSARTKTQPKQTTQPKRRPSNLQSNHLRNQLDAKLPQKATPKEIMSRTYNDETPKAQVEELQRFLKSKGYNPGKIDGDWGRNTRAALTLAKAKGVGQGEPSGSMDLKFKFDGEHLHVRDRNGDVIRSFPARSGLPKGSPAIPGLNKKHGLNLDQNKDYTGYENQDVDFAGPTPEARYTLSLSESMKFEKTGGGWGVGGWGLDESLINRRSGRNGFFIHHDGGSEGTAGCVGLVNGADVKELQKLLQAAHECGQESVTLKVDYPGNSNGFWDYL